MFEFLSYKRQQSQNDPCVHLISHKFGIFWGQFYGAQVRQVLHRAQTCFHQWIKSLIIGSNVI